MKSLIIVIIGSFVICYLLGAFTAASFNLNKWSEFERGCTAWIVGLIILCYSFVRVMEGDFNTRK